MPRGRPAMGGQLVQWSIACVVDRRVRGLHRGPRPAAHDLAVSRCAGATAFSGHSLALWENSIWFKRAWSTTIKSSLDGLVYGLLTAGTFGGLWPRWAGLRPEPPAERRPLPPWQRGESLHPPGGGL